VGVLIVGAGLAVSQNASQTAAAKKPVAKSKQTVKKRPVSWRASQVQPTPERYSQIQQALIDKGYLQGTATGVWGPESMAALKRFQEEQKLEATGKLDSLSLIRLGLGPKKVEP
jgi:peptidoglycan hydrolase-like protein with peptidoglycan-binding domain